jgi:hypothetical protein
LSFNRSLDELRKGFEDLRRRLYRLCDASTQSYPDRTDKEAWSQGFKDETSLAAVRLLRSLESAASDAEVMSDASTKLYATRLGLEVDSFRVVIEGQVLMRMPSTDRVGQTVSRTLGLPTGGSVTNYILKTLDAENFCSAFDMLNKTRGVFFSALEDIRMLYEMRLLPLEERGRIREGLTNAGMPEVADRLVKADAQRVDDPPGCIGNCREVFATTIHKLAELRAGRATDSVSGDLAELGKKEVVSPEERRVMVALYSFMSDRWKAPEKPNSGDAEFALKQTYFFVDRLLGWFGTGKPSS